MPCSSLHTSLGNCKGCLPPNQIAVHRASSKQAGFTGLRGCARRGDQALPGDQPGRRVVLRIKTWGSLGESSRRNPKAPRLAGDKSQSLHSCQSHTSWAPDRLEPAPEQVEMGKPEFFRWMKRLMFICKLRRKQHYLFYSLVFSAIVFAFPHALMLMIFSKNMKVCFRNWGKRLRKDNIGKKSISPTVHCGAFPYTSCRSRGQFWILWSWKPSRTPQPLPLQPSPKCNPTQEEGSSELLKLPGLHFSLPHASLLKQLKRQCLHQLKRSLKYSGE